MPAHIANECTITISCTILTIPRDTAAVATARAFELETAAVEALQGVRRWWLDKTTITATTDVFSD